MATASATSNTLAKVREALAFLRESGREDEAAAIESLVPAVRPRRLPTAPPPDERELVPIAAAATRLGLSRNAVQRRIDIGLLEGVRDERNGYRYVTRRSLEALKDAQEMIATIAIMPGDADRDHDPDSLLAQMLREAKTIDPSAADGDPR
jgi:hypothetical protein